MRIRDEAWGKPSTSDVVAKDDAEDGSDARGLSDTELMREAMERAKRLGAS